MSKKPDYLTLCSIAAQKAGTSYGKYMAMHGYHPPIQADVEDVEAPQGISKICPHQGMRFLRYLRRPMCCLWTRERGLSVFPSCTRQRNGHRLKFG